MNARLTKRFSAVLLSLFVLVLLVPLGAAYGQDISPQSIIVGGIQQGNWYEQWNQPGTIYCPGNNQMFITSTNEPFTLRATPDEGVLTISYTNSRTTIQLARASNGSYVYTDATNRWVHLLQATVVSPNQVSLLSTFYAQDGSCTLNNTATWTFSGSPQPQPPPTGTCTVTPTSNALNKRSGPGLNYPILGQLLRGQYATVTNVSYDSQGQRWWFLVDNTWVAAAYTVSQGNCPS